MIKRLRKGNRREEVLLINRKEEWTKNLRQFREKSPLLRLMKSRRLSRRKTRNERIQLSWNRLDKWRLGKGQT